MNFSHRKLLKYLQFNFKLQFTNLFRVISCSGGINFDFKTDDTLTLINNGTYWLEISRSINRL